MKILLTGASGFLGQHLKQVFLNLDHEVFTLGRSTNDNIVSDITTSFKISKPVDLVVHAAGKAHIIPKTAEEEHDFFKVNSEGTQNLLNALESNSPKAFVYISTVAVYGLDQGENISEDNLPLGKTPYALSKIAAEQRAAEWGKAKNVPVLILRLPLITGYNPPGNLGAMAKAIKKGYYFRIGSGEARRSMISADAVGRFILDTYNSHGVFNLTDDEHPKINETDTFIAHHFGKQVRSLPTWVAGIAAKVGDFLPGFPIGSDRLEKLTSTLTFSNQLAKELGWEPKPALNQLSFTD